jgi:hypothetical protein
MLGGGPFFHILVIFSIQVAQRHSFLLSSRPPRADLFWLHNQQKRVNVPITTDTPSAGFVYTVHIGHRDTSNHQTPH